jgi:hypothetical protein
VIGRQLILLAPLARRLHARIYQQIFYHVPPSSGTGIFFRCPTATPPLGQRQQVIVAESPRKKLGSESILTTNQGLMYAPRAACGPGPIALTLHECDKLDGGRPNIGRVHKVADL